MEKSCTNKLEKYFDVIKDEIKTAKEKSRKVTKEISEIENYAKG